MKFLDKFFVVFHTIVIIFNVFGWMWEPTRRANLVLLLVTGFCWVVIGFWKGWGYCPLTDWHFQVLRKLGVTELPSSYVKYIIFRVSGINLEGRLVDIITLSLFILALIGSIVTNFWSWKNK